MSKADQEDAKTLSLHGGRKLGYTEIGKPDGLPVIYCHGFPASRREIGLIENVLPAQVRLVAADRPGYGLSEFQPGRQIADWAADMAELADALGIGRFAVLGVSGGAPYALALAATLRERVSAAGIVCGLGPVYREEARMLMHWPARFAFGGPREWVNFTYGHTLAPTIRWQPEIVLKMLAMTMAPADQRVVGQPNVHAILCASMREAVRQGSAGPLWDLGLYSSDWAFDPAAITCPVTFWHGERDSTVPFEHMAMNAAAIGHAELLSFSDDGHFSLPIERGGEILQKLIGEI